MLTLNRISPSDMRNGDESIMAADWFDCYQFEGITLIPSYLDRNQYVQPGHTYDTPKKTFTAHQLEKAGAKRVTESLWLRR